MRRVVLLVGVVAAAGVCRGPLNRDLQALGRRAYEVYFQFHPVDATRYGCHEHDSLLASYSAERVRAYLGRVRAFLDTLARLDTSRMGPDDLIDRELLVSNLKMELFWFERLRWQERNPKLYTGECIDAVYFLLLRDFAPLEERARLVARRLGRTPRFLAEARRNVRNPPRLYALAAIDDLRTGEGFLRESAAELADRFPDMAGVLVPAAESALAAMRRWRQELEGMLPGLSDGFAMGREAFDYLLRTDKFLDFDSDSLLRMGENLLRSTDSAIRALDSARHEYYLRHNEPVDTQFPSPAGFSKADFRAYQQAEIESMRVWTQRQAIADVPDWVGRLEVKETPAFLLSIIPGLAMEPAAPLDSVQTGYVYVRPMAEQLDSARRQELYNSARKRGWKGGVVHEGFPGHHFQLSLANRHPSFIRRLQSNTPLIEGWALYCEQMVVEQGLYGPDPFPQRRWLGGVKFRAARIVVDANLHTGRMGYGDALRFMMEQFGPDTAFFSGEVRRYCLSPGQPMSYLVGKTQIMALREDSRRQQGERFSLRDFHNRLLGEGSIPVGLIRRKLISN